MPRPRPVLVSLLALLPLVGVACSGAPPAPAAATSIPTRPSTAATSNTSPPSTAAPQVRAPSVITPPSDPARVLPDDRRTTWNPGVTYGGGGIPERTDVCAHLSPTGGDDTDDIQAALDDCAAGGVVELAAGTFEIHSPGIQMRTSDVTLRGSGTGTPDSGEGGTRLVKADRETNAGALLYVGNNPTLFASSTDLAEDAVLGSNQVVLEEDPGLAVGERVLVDQVTDDDPDVFWGPSHDGPGGPSRAWFDRPDRSLSQILEVAAIDGETVTFATPFHWTFRTAFEAQLSRYGDDVGGNVLPFVEWAGVEDIYFHGGTGGDFHGNVAVSTCAYCWVRNIESDFADGTSVGFYGTYRSELRDSYIHSSANPNPGGGGYLTGLNFGAADNLLENNILWQGNKTIVMRASGGGNVVAYNYLEDAYGEGYPGYVEVGLNATHYTTPHMELLEGNEAFNVDGDTKWGNSISITVFRNHLTGLRRDVGGVGLSDGTNRRIAALNDAQYDYNFVGNVLGTDGMQLLPGQTRFVYEATDLDEPEVPVWQLGYYSEEPDRPFDPAVAASTLRFGNFDYVTGAVDRRDGFPEQLPPSLYLTAKPAFFGDLPWPWVTPDDPTRRVATLPARARFDAMSHPG